MQYQPLSSRVSGSKAQTREYVDDLEGDGIAKRWLSLKYLSSIAFVVWGSGWGI